MKTALPRMIAIRQIWPRSTELDFSSLLEGEITRAGIREQIRPGMRIAVGVGSRGIANLKEIVKAAIDALIRAGARPFIVPAMGSHGGATPEGQIQILAEFGITAESMGVPIEAGMEVRKIGTVSGLIEKDELDVVFSAAALDADAVIPVNRIKPHTDFPGPLGSGIQKMLTIGFGKQVGAANAHRTAAHVGHEAAIRAFSRVILDAVPVLGAIAVVEDQHHQTASVEVLRPDEIVSADYRLYEKSKSLMPHLPLEEIDLLIVDQIGKEISGTGMDTNVVGRELMGYSASLRGDESRSPMIHRIFARDLSAATHGNAIGIGLADFTTTRMVNAMDKRSTYINVLTSLGLLIAKIPIQFDTDREAIDAALASLASLHLERLRVVRIKNTLALDHMQVSESCADAVRELPGVRIEGDAHEMMFDSSDNLLPF
jgi:hypothetical protein